MSTAPTEARRKEGVATPGNDIAVNSERPFLLFLWRDKKSPLLVPLSCLAHKMIHSRILCKSPSELRVDRSRAGGEWRSPVCCFFAPGFRLRAASSREAQFRLQCLS